MLGPTRRQDDDDPHRPRTSSNRIAERITFDASRSRRDLWNQIGYLPEERGLYKKSKIISTMPVLRRPEGMSECEAEARWLPRWRRERFRAGRHWRPLAK